MITEPKIKKQLKFEEVMDILQISRPTLYKILKSKELHAIKIGVEWRISPDDLQTFLYKKKEAQGLTELTA
jgi:excisionase family DNA binding protein